MIDTSHVMCHDGMVRRANRKTLDIGDAPERQPNTGASHLTAATVRQYTRLVRSVARRYAWAMPIEDLCQAVWARLSSRPVGEHGLMTIEAYIASQATCACIDEVRSVTRRGTAPVMVEHDDQGEHDPWAGTEATMDLVYLLASMPESERTETIRMASAESDRTYASEHGHSKKWGNDAWHRNVKKLRRLAREET